VHMNGHGYRAYGLAEKKTGKDDYTKDGYTPPPPPLKKGYIPPPPPPTKHPPPQKKK